MTPDRLFLWRRFCYARGKTAARRIADAMPTRVTVIDRATAAEGLKAGFAQYDAVVAVMAAGAVVRILAPLIAAGHKSSDPAILVVDDAGRFVIPILGGHAAGANALATELAEILGAEAVVTTATDVAGVAGAGRSRLAGQRRRQWREPRSARRREGHPRQCPPMATAGVG